MAERIKLNRQERQQAREEARYFWMQCHDVELARSAMLSHLKVKGFDPATILLFIEIAVKLWQLWSRLSVSEPSVVPSAEESNAMEDSDEQFD